MPEVLFSFIECCKRCLPSPFVSQTDPSTFSFLFPFVFSFFNVRFNSFIVRECSSRVEHEVYRERICERVFRLDFRTILVIMESGVSRLTLISSARIGRIVFRWQWAGRFRSFITTAIFLIRPASIPLIRCNRIYHIGFSIYTRSVFYRRGFFLAKKAPRGD